MLTSSSNEKFILNAKRLKKQMLQLKQLTNNQAKNHQRHHKLFGYAQLSGTELIVKGGDHVEAQELQRLLIATFARVERPHKFSRKNPIRLVAHNNADTKGVSDSSAHSNDLFIYCSTGWELEKWYYSISRAMISKQSNTDSNYWDTFTRDHNLAPSATKTTFPAFKVNKTTKSLGVNAMAHDCDWLNVLLGRVWMSVGGQKRFRDFWNNKLSKSLELIKKPAVLGEIRLKSLNVGQYPPVLTNARLINYQTDVIEMAFNLDYKGMATIHLETEFQSNNLKVPISLSITFEQISGQLLLKSHKYPSSNLWWCFKEPPLLKVSISPLLGDTNFGFHIVKDAIDKRLRHLINEIIVWPNMECLQLASGIDAPPLDSTLIQWMPSVASNTSTTETAAVPEVEITESQQTVAEQLMKHPEFQKYRNQMSPLIEPKTAPNTPVKPSPIASPRIVKSPLLTPSNRAHSFLGDGVLFGRRSRQKSNNSTQ